MQPTLLERRPSRVLKTPPTSASLDAALSYPKGPRIYPFVIYVGLEMLSI